MVHWLVQEKKNTRKTVVAAEVHEQRVRISTFLYTRRDKDITCPRIKQFGCKIMFTF